VIGALTRDAAAPAAQRWPPSLFRHVGDQITRLMPLLGVERSTPQIREAFAILCRESLAPPEDDQVPRVSRLNADGTPFQFGLTLGSTAPLQFLSEPTRPSASNVERLQAARGRIDALSSLFGIDDVADVHAWLDRAAPVDDPDLAADDAGPVWLGAAFTPSKGPTLKVYVNAKWGRPRDRWTRIAMLADYVGAAAEWRTLRPLLHDALQPLGVALILSADGPPEGRIYFRGPDMRFEDYESLAAACGCGAACAHLPALKMKLLADDAAFATRSAVCSFGLQGGTGPAYKFEVCAHCAFASDAVAQDRCHRWLIDGGFDPETYLRLVDLLLPGAPSTRQTRLHSFVGIGERRGGAYPTLYFNPAAAL